MAIFPYTTGSHCRQVTIFLENVRFRNMRIMTLISIVSWLPMASSTSPFTYGAVEVIFGSIYFYFHLQTAPDLQDCPHSTNLPTISESTLYLILEVRSRWGLWMVVIWCKVKSVGIVNTWIIPSTVRRQWHLALCQLCQHHCGQHQPRYQHCHQIRLSQPPAAR